MPIFVIQGDITQQPDDAIVNAANENLLAGGGVCAAIHRAAGPELEHACLSLGRRCPTGSAVITQGFGLNARYVIHAVGPRWLGGIRGEAELLNACYESIFRLVEESDLSSVSIPAISTGIYHYPLEQATEIAISTAQRFLQRSNSVAITFVCFDGTTYDVYQSVLGRMTTQS